MLKEHRIFDSGISSFCVNIDDVPFFAEAGVCGGTIRKVKVILPHFYQGW